MIKNRQNGITLIALVITVIVLLILAGVSISLVAGENGILKKATTSSEATKKGVAIEQVSLAWSACQTDYLTSGSGSEKSTFFTKEKLNENISQGEIIQVNFGKDETGVSEVIYELDNSSYTIEITKNGEVSIVGDITNPKPEQPIKTKYSVTKILEGTGVTFSNNEETVEEGATYNTNISVEGNYILETVTVMMAGTEVTTGITIADNKKSGAINIENVTGNIVITVVAEEKVPNIASEIKEKPSEYYGKKVTGYIANGISDWRIFYADDKNIFLITTDYLPSSKAVLCNNTMSTNGIYNVYWNSIPTVASIENVTKFSPVTSETIAWTANYGTNTNVKCVSTLLDTNKWTSFVDGNKATMAIGSPTLNMWVASWNEKYPTDKIYCNNSNAIGYYVGTSNIPTSTFIDDSTMSKKVGYQLEEEENMYYPHKNLVDSNCFGYWISAPSAERDTFMMCVSHNGNVYRGSYNDSGGLCVRPVVCLKSGIEMTKNSDDTIAIGNVK